MINSKIMPKKKDDNPLIGGAALIIIGIIFIFNITFGWGVMWPLFIAFGGVMAVINYLVNKEDLKDVVSGVIITFTIAGFFSLFTTGVFSWSDMAWLWPVFLLAPGLGLLAHYFVSKEGEVLIPAGILITLFVIFIGFSSSELWNYWPIILIVIGAIIVIANKLGKKT